MRKAAVQGLVLLRWAMEGQLERSQVRGSVTTLILSSGKMQAKARPVGQRKTRDQSLDLDRAPEICRVFPLRPCSSPMRLPGLIRFTDEKTEAQRREGRDSLGATQPVRDRARGSADSTQALSIFFQESDKSLERGPGTFGGSIAKALSSLPALSSSWNSGSGQGGWTHLGRVLVGVIWPLPCSGAN